MRRATSNLEHNFKSGARGKKTSIGFGNVGTSTMNKSKRRRSIGGFGSTGTK